MTREELRQELKETEGDPQLKARIRGLQRDVARRRMMAEVPKADVVVTNPDHYAVALRYTEGTMRARAWWRRARCWSPSASSNWPATTASGAARAAAGAGAVRPRGGRAGDPGRAVQRRGRGAGVGVPAAPVRGAATASVRTNRAACRCRPSSILVCGATAYR